MRFLITSRQKSGTLFLSKLMNRSKEWTVLHEPQVQKDLRFLPRGNIAKSLAPGLIRSDKEMHLRLSLLRERYSGRSHYGEVNGITLPLIKELVKQGKGECGKLGMLVRDPYLIVVSIINRRAKRAWQAFLEDFKQELETIEWCLTEGLKQIDFGKVTTDPSYAQAIIEHFGITDLTVTQKMVSDNPNKTKNSRAKDGLNSLDVLTTEQRYFIDSFCEPFVEKWIK